MLTLVLNIAVICFMMALAAVFVVQWFKKLAGAVTVEKSVSSVALSIFSLLLSIGLAVLAYNGLREYLPKAGEEIIIVLAFVILGFMQLVWENYSMLKEWGLGLVKKKIEKETE